MYIATEDSNEVGSTRLHMDVTCAVNLMVHVVKGTGDALENGARWDIFLAEDSKKLRAYLYELRQANRT